MAYLRLHTAAGYFSIPADDGERLALELGKLDDDANAVSAGRLLLDNLTYGRPKDIELVGLDTRTLRTALGAIVASGVSISDSTYVLWKAVASAGLM